MSYISVVSAGQAQSVPDKEWRASVCRWGQGAEQCRYIVWARDANTYRCLKRTPALKARQDLMAAANRIEARGDHCVGRGYV